MGPQAGSPAQPAAGTKVLPGPQSQLSMAQSSSSAAPQTKPQKPAEEGNQRPPVARQSEASHVPCSAVHSSSDVKAEAHPSPTHSQPQKSKHSLPVQKAPR